MWSSQNSGGDPKVKIRRDPRAVYRSKVWRYAVVLFIGALGFVYMQGMWLSRNRSIFAKSYIAVQNRRIPCDYCGELGTVRNPQRHEKMDVCPVCFGVGYHVIRKFDKHDTLCPLCGGAGRVVDESSGYAQTCPRCDGRGVIRNVE